MLKQRKSNRLHLYDKTYNVVSAYKFYRKGKTQKLIHEFKYNNRIEIGEFFAEKMAPHLQNIKNSKYIIPVPIHWKKERKRGYNQSYVLAKKIAELNGLQLLENVLYRKSDNKSQTKKSRYHRFSEIDGAFGLKETSMLENEHLILVDDIVTTGATVGACIRQLEKIQNIRITIVCIAN